MRIQKISTLLLLALCLTACKSRKHNRIVTKKTETTSPKNTSKHTTSPSNTNSFLADKIIETAKEYEGVRYKYGGTTKRGMDCSGLVTTVFSSENISLPRTTSELSKTGDWVDLKNVQKGDLVFFATKKNSRNVNHVGIVTESLPGYVEFIHSSTSKGVMISNLSERYWYFAYVQARRIL